MTKKEVAALVRVHTRTVERWISARQLPFFRIGNTLRVRRVDVLSVMDRFEYAPPVSHDPSLG